MNLLNLSTNKPHISFSEFSIWSKCSYRHYLEHIKKINLNKPNPGADFGTAIHLGVQEYVLNKKINENIFIEKFNNLWENNKSLNEEKYDETQKDLYLYVGKEIINSEFPKWFDSTFPNWECIHIEHNLYEQIESKPENAFKGYIDCVIKIPYKKGYVYWLLDFKTCSWGWNQEKKSDINVKAQLILYKNFYSKKFGIPLNKIKVGFILLKRISKPTKRCELLSFSAGPSTIKKINKLVNNMIYSIKKDIKIKNRYSCDDYCPYKNTEHCL